MRIILTLQVGLDEHDARMLNKSVTPTQVEFSEIMVVENEDQVAEGESAMEEVETEAKKNLILIKEVLTTKGY
jgi:hypothetical protein